MKKKSGGGGKLRRSESVTVRLSGRTKYGAELAGMKKRRTVSSYVETVIEESFRNIKIEVFADDGKERCEVTVKELLHTLWDIEESKRFILRAFHCPWLLTDEEEALFNQIKKNTAFWGTGGKCEASLKTIDFESINQNWEILSDGLTRFGESSLSLKWERLKPLEVTDSDFELIKDTKNYCLFPSAMDDVDIYKRIKEDN